MRRFFLFRLNSDYPNKLSFDQGGKKSRRERKREREAARLHRGMNQQWTFVKFV